MTDNPSTAKPSGVVEENSLEDFVDDIIGLQENIESLKQQVTPLKEEITNTTNQIESLKQQVTPLTEEIANNTNQIESLKQEIASLKQKLQPETKSSNIINKKSIIILASLFGIGLTALVFLLRA